MKKLLILILLFSLTGCGNQVDLGAKKIKEEKVKVEKLKATKNKILLAEDIDECVEWKDEMQIECKKSNKVKKYHYISDKKVPVQKINHNGKELTEDISKRTGNSVHFKVVKDDKLLGATETGDEYVAKFYAGTPFIENSGEWYQTETATTTLEIYEEETATTTAEYILDYFINIVVAQTTTDFDANNGGSQRVYKLTSGAVAQALWDSVHDATTGTASGGGWFNVGTFMDGGIGRILIGRGPFSINTSAIPDTDTISASSLHVYVLGVAEPSTNAYSYYGMVESTQASDTAITTADYNQIGAVNNPTLLATNVDTADLTTSTYTGNEWVMNASGISVINKTGYTTIGLRHGSDIEDVFVSPGGSDIRRTLQIDVNTNLPYLQITYSAGGAERRIIGPF